MTGVLRVFLASSRPFWLLALAATALFVVLRVHRLPEGELRGDEGTYVAMTASLARDLDLAFDAEDAGRAFARATPPSLILQRTADGVAYSKPFVYPLLAAPFYAVAGERGMVAANALALAVALLLAAAFLGRLGDRDRAVETVLSFVFVSTLVPYAVWRTPESVQTALAAAGLALALAPLRPSVAPARGLAARLLASKRAPWVGMALLGVLVATREPFAAVAAVPVAAAALAGAGRRAVKLLAVAALAYLACVGASWALGGAPNPYKARRATFNGDTGYPAGVDPAAAAAALARFERDDAWATSSLGLRPDLEPRTSGYAALYFLVGRHSGLAVYLPAVLGLALAASRRPDRTTLAALGGLAALALFFLVWWPSNYFGGETFVGNRYLLAGTPCVLLGLARLPSRRTLFAIWAAGAVVGLSALASVRRAGALDPTSQSHAHAGVFRLLPYESTAAHIDGRRDRYWSGDFLRFVDPYATVQARELELAAGAPAAEIEVATTSDDPRSVWLVRCDRPGATLVVSDWLDTDRFPLGARGGGSGGPVVFEASRAWRRHPFWWSHGALARARLVRLRLEAPDPEARATVRYLGRRALPERLTRELRVDGLPAAAAAGGVVAARLELVNSGDWTWSSEDVLPVQVGVRFSPLGPGAPPVERRVPLPRAVAPGERLEMPLPLELPAAAGEYRVTIDLVLEDVAWFGERGATPAVVAELSLD